MNKKIKVVCGSCGHCGYVSDEAEKISTIIEAFTDTQFPCQECNGIYQRGLGDAPEKPVSFMVTADQFWKFGYGSPPKGVDDVLDNLLGQTIVDAVGRMEGDRVVLDKLVLKDGTTLWLGTAGRDSVVYRMKEGSNDGECERTQG